MEVDVAGGKGRHASDAAGKIIQGTLDTILEQIKGRKLPHEHLIYVGDFLAKRYNERTNHE